MPVVLFTVFIALSIWSGFMAYDEYDRASMDGGLLLGLYALTSTFCLVCAFGMLA